jgi:hypothetical protein
VEDLQTHLEGMKLKDEALPKELQHHPERVVLEGNDVRTLLHKNTFECTTIFKEFSDWMGVITYRNEKLEDLCTIIHTLNEEATKRHDSLEQQEKIYEIQRADNSLNALFEAKIVEKEELGSFNSIVQTT